MLDYIDIQRNPLTMTACDNLRKLGHRGVDIAVDIDECTKDSIVHEIKTDVIDVSTRMVDVVDKVTSDSTRGVDMVDKPG